MIMLAQSRRRPAPGLSFALAILCAGYAGHTAVGGGTRLDRLARSIMGLRSRKPGPRTACSGFSSPGPGAPIAPAWSAIPFLIRWSFNTLENRSCPSGCASTCTSNWPSPSTFRPCPATIIVAPNRDVVAIHEGYLGPAEFDAFLRDSVSRVPGQSARRQASTGMAGSPAKAEPTSDKPQTSERLAMRGYCPVSLIRDRKLVPGQSEHNVQHEGLTYRFASLAKKELFREQPDRFLPANNGACPVTQLDQGGSHPGDPRWGILYQSHLFLFASDLARHRFLQEPDRYAMVDVAEQGFCIHCIRESGLLVRGDPHHEIAREGRRYWFPDLSHRDAFLTSRR